MTSTRNQNNHNSRFYMVSASFPQIINKLAHEHLSALLVLSALEDCSDDYGASIVNQRDIGKCIGKCTVTVQKATRYLEDNHYIKIVKINNHNAYIINPNLLWHSREHIRSTVAKNLKFTSATRITQRMNRPYFLKHTELERHIENSRYYLDIIQKYIDNHKGIQTKLNKRTTKSQAIMHIKSLVKQIHATPREKEVIKFLLARIPLDANKPLKKTNKDIQRLMNKTIARDNHIGYTTVANATFKLHKNSIIIRHHKCIEYNPELLPLKRRSIH